MNENTHGKNTADENLKDKVKILIRVKSIV